MIQVVWTLDHCPTDLEMKSSKSKRIAVSHDHQYLWEKNNFGTLLCRSANLVTLIYHESICILYCGISQFIYSLQIGQFYDIDFYPILVPH